MALHLTVLAMLVTFLPHCLFGCSMEMGGAAAAPALVAVMDCCAGACPMDHGDVCLSSEDDSSAPSAIVKNGPTIPDPALAAVAEGTSLSPSAPARPTPPASHASLSPPVPLHLLNAQFLI